jgi:septum formation protein
MARYTSPMVKADQARAGPGSTEGYETLATPARLLLASQSPRRREILRQHGLDHDARHPGIDDSTLDPGRVTPFEWAAALAYLKAAAGAAAEGPSRLVIGADTICVKDGMFIGQPADAADAERIIRLLQDAQHEVITGVALIWTGRDGVRRRRIFVDRARVHVGQIGNERIREYIASGQWRGKAGAYNLSERLEAGWPVSVEGDPTTVMGLPMRSLRRVLEALGLAEPDAAPPLLTPS